MKRQAKQARALATVDTILTGAAQVLEQVGYGLVTTDRIAERAGVSVGSVYQYFGNKEDVFAALLDRETAGLLGKLQEELERVEEDPHVRLAHFLRVGASREFLGPELFYELARSPALVEKLEIFSRQVVELTYQFVAELRADASPDEIRTFAELVVASAEGIGRPLRGRDSDELLEAYITMVDGYLLRSDE